MPDTTLLLSQFYIKIDGQLASEPLMHNLMDATVENSLHLPDVATLTLHDPDGKWVDDGSLSPGKTLEISAKAGSPARDTLCIAHTVRASTSRHAPAHSRNRSCSPSPSRARAPRPRTTRSRSWKPSWPRPGTTSRRSRERSPPTRRRRRTSRSRSRTWKRR